MRGTGLTRPATLFLAAAVLALGTSACGGDGDSGSTSSGSTAERGSAGRNGGAERGGAAEQGRGRGDHGKGSEEAGGISGESGQSNGSGSQAGGASDPDRFIPKPHEDPGGGAEQFRVKGGDNSIQEFGSDATGSDFEEVATALHNFLDARAVQDWDAACSFLAESVRQSLQQLVARANQIEDTSCGAILSKLTNPAAQPEMRAEAAQADVGSVRLEGDRAFVIYRGVDDTVIAIPMANDGGRWKVAALAGTPLS